MNQDQNKKPQNQNTQMGGGQKQDGQQQATRQPGGQEQGREQMNERGNDRGNPGTTERVQPGSGTTGSQRQEGEKPTGNQQPKS